MSFTDQQQRIATEEECSAEWDGLPNGKAFRCELCGYKFTPGDKWRWIYGRGKTVNFMVCEKCDPGNDCHDQRIQHADRQIFSGG